METLVIEQLRFTYPRQSVPALDRVSLSLERGNLMLICGESGCGKSTLLRSIVPQIAPFGQKSGRILLDNCDISTYSSFDLCKKIGFVSQHPDEQIVTENGWQEMAFGLENLGLAPELIRRRVAETASFFGLEALLHTPIEQLSGGQKQLLNLASVMVMQPDLLVLDEPASQLDPIGRGELIAVLRKIKEELSCTIIIAEHNLEDFLTICDQVAIMEKGKILCAGDPESLIDQLCAMHHPILAAFPSPVRIWSAVMNPQSSQRDVRIPRDAREGRAWLEEFAASTELNPLAPRIDNTPRGEELLRMEDVSFRYDRNAKNVLDCISLRIFKGEFLALLGGNGAGKSTALNVMAGALPCREGKRSLRGRVGLLPQNPAYLFVETTLRADLALVGAPMDGSYCAEILRVFRLNSLLDRHPSDLSGGELQRAALAKILLTRPDILLLDEPTKGMDAPFKAELAAILRRLQNDGKAIVMVSHDLDFCASYTDRCALFFDGGIVAEESSAHFFAGNRFYTTAASRMSRTTIPDAVTVEDVVRACGGSLPEMPAEPNFPPPPTDDNGSDDEEKSAGKLRSRTGIARRIVGWISGLCSVGLFIYSAFFTDLKALFRGTALTETAYRNIVLYVLLLITAGIFGWSISKKNAHGIHISLRRILRNTAYVALIALTLLLGVRFFGGRKYLITATLLLIEGMLPFFVRFERRRPSARELALLAILCAITVAGRAAFFMIPQFKPVMAMVILSAAALGGENGFLVGAISMLVSNIFFSQGPWTPWQMFGMGMVGFVAGWLIEFGLIDKNSRVSLCIFGFFAATVLYGGLLNPASVILYQPQPNLRMVVASYLTGFPVDLIQALATIFFIAVGGRPVLASLERIKKKYGIFS